MLNKSRFGWKLNPVSRDSAVYKDSIIVLVGARNLAKTSSFAWQYNQRRNIKVLFFLLIWRIVWYSVAGESKTLKIFYVVWLSKLLFWFCFGPSTYDIFIH